MWRFELALGGEASCTGPLIAASCAETLLTACRCLRAGMNSAHDSGRMNAHSATLSAVGTCKPHLAMHVLLHTIAVHGDGDHQLMLPCPRRYPRRYTSAPCYPTHPPIVSAMSSIHAVCAQGMQGQQPTPDKRSSDASRRRLCVACCMSCFDVSHALPASAMRSSVSLHDALGNAVILRR